MSEATRNTEEGRLAAELLGMVAEIFFKATDSAGVMVHKTSDEDLEIRIIQVEDTIEAKITNRTLPTPAEAARRVTRISELMTRFWPEYNKFKH